MLPKNLRLITVIISQMVALHKPTRCSRATGQMMLKLLKLSHVFNTASRGSASDDALMKSAHRAAGCAMTMTTCPPPPKHACAGARHASEGEGRGARPLLRLPYHKLSLTPRICTFTSSPIRPSLFHCACLSSALGCLLCGRASGIHWGENKSQNSSAPFGNFGKTDQQFKVHGEHIQF